MDSAAVLKQLEEQEARIKKADDARWAAMSEAEKAAFKKGTRNLAAKMQSSVG